MGENDLSFLSPDFKAILAQADEIKAKNE